jgi:hypothetical protein
MLLAVVLALALVAAACTSSAETTTTTTTEGGDTDTSVTTTTTIPDETSSTTTVPPITDIPGSASDSLDPAVVERIQSEIAELILAAEEVRGLPFLETPTVTILDEQEFAARVGDLIAEELDQAETATDQAYFSMMGMWDDGMDLYQFLIDLYTEQVAGFYDAETKEMVVPASADGFTTLQEITVIHELVHALTDQHFDYNDEYERRFDEGTGDDAVAMSALLEGDATYFQLVFMQELSVAEALQAAMESLTIDTGSLDAAPQWLQDDLLFPYQEGLNLLETIVAEGGIAAADLAYANYPDTTEQVLDPNKYLRAEAPRDLESLAVSLPGWEEHDAGSLGEWGFRLILTDTLQRGAVTQAAAGWGNDDYRILTDGTEIAFVLHYVGDSESDTEDLTNGLIAHARSRMDTGESVEDGGGLLFDQGEVYVFVDRVEDELFFIAATDAAAGAGLRAQLGL